MSLSDALVVLDPHRDSREVWLVAEDTGRRGDGTQANPYNGSSISSIAHPAISIESLSVTDASNKIATAVTNDNHGFSSGDRVTISGVDVKKKPGLFWPEEFYLGTFSVSVINSNTFTFAMLGLPDASPAPGNIQCWKERERFDVILNSMPAKATIHLGHQRTCG